MPKLDPEVLNSLQDPIEPTTATSPSAPILDEDTLKQLEMSQAPTDPNLQAVTKSERLGIKNLISNSPTLQKEYLDRKGYKTRLNERTKEIEIYSPKDKTWGVIDPSGIDSQDFSDIVGDLIEATIGIAATSAGTVGGGILGSVTPVPGGAALGAIAGGAYSAGVAASGTEALRQKIAKELGFREDVNPKEIEKAGENAGITTALFSVPGKILSALSGETSRRASALLQQHSKAETRRMGRTLIKSVAETTKKEVGARNIATRSADELEAMIRPALSKLGKEIKVAHHQLDEVIPPIVGKEAIEAESNRITNTIMSKFNFPSEEAENALRSTFKDLLNRRKSNTLKSSDIWELAQELETKAKTFTGDAVPEMSKADVLTKAARLMRSELYDKAKRNKINLAEKSEKYYKLKIAHDAYDDIADKKWSGTDKASGPFPMGLQVSSQVSKRARAAIPEGAGVGTAVQLAKPFSGGIADVVTGITGSILDRIDSARRSRREAETK